MIGASEVIDVHTTEDVMEMAEKRTTWVSGIIHRALGILKPGDVVSMEGKPYIVAPGCYKVARLFGVSIKYGGKVPQKVIGQDDLGVYYFYVHGATVSLPNGIDAVDVIGNCSSRDKFFAMVRGEWRPQSEVDELDIMQKCVTNCDRKGIVKLLGLENFTWDDLQKFAKITMQQCQSFSFKKPAAPEKAATQQQSPALQQAVRTSSPLGTAPPKTETAPVASGSSGPTGQVQQEEKSRKQVALEHIEAWRGKHDVTLVSAIKTLTGGKSTLGQLTDDELEGIITKCVQDSGS